MPSPPGFRSSIPASTCGSSTLSGSKWLHVVVDEFEFEVVARTVEADGDLITTAHVVADEIGEELFDNQVDLNDQPLVVGKVGQVFAEEIEDLTQRGNLPRKTPTRGRQSRHPSFGARYPFRKIRSGKYSVVLSSAEYSSTKN